MEFVSQAEYITTLLLIPIFSTGLFIILSSIEILDKHGEILFLNKKHAYTNKDFILPFIISLLIGLLFYGVYFELENYVKSFPPVEVPPQPCEEYLNDISKHKDCIKEFTDKAYLTIWKLF